METFATGSDRQFSENEKMSFDLCAVCKRIKHSALLYCCLPVLRNGQRLVTQRGISLASQWKMMESSGK